MLSPLKPLLCRHDFYWSERHLSERCRRCAKLRAGQPISRLAASPLTIDPLPASSPAEGILIGFDESTRPSVRAPETIPPTAKVLKAQAGERRGLLLGLLDRLIEGAQPTREEAIDAVLAVIEDAHSADPVLFGAAAAGHFARLYEARSGRPC